MTLVNPPIAVPWPSPGRPDRKSGCILRTTIGEVSVKRPRLLLASAPGGPSSPGGVAILGAVMVDHDPISREVAALFRAVRGPDRCAFRERYALVEGVGRAAACQVLPMGADNRRGPLGNPGGAGELGRVISLVRR